MYYLCAIWLLLFLITCFVLSKKDACKTDKELVLLSLSVSSFGAGFIYLIGEFL